MKTIIEQTPTPGTWWKEERKDLRGNPVGFTIWAKNPLAITDKGRVIVAKTPDCWSPQVQANAALIAAAPDMAEALIMALPYIETAELDEGYKPGAVGKISKQIKAALTKAGVL